MLTTASMTFGIHLAVTGLMQVNVLWLTEVIIGAILGDDVLSWPQTINCYDEVDQLPDYRRCCRRCHDIVVSLSRFCRA